MQLNISPPGERWKEGTEGERVKEREGGMERERGPGVVISNHIDLSERESERERERERERDTERGREGGREEERERESARDRERDPV